MTLDQTLGLIASRAAVLVRGYPNSAAELQRERRLLRDVREDVRTGHLPEADLATARHGYRSHQAVCEQWRERVHDLAALVALHLPDLYRTVRHVVRFNNARWHDIDGFDWDPIVDELQMIESAALAEATADYYVDLDQAAAYVNKSKRTLERLLSKMPAPEVQGSGGTKNEWKWSTLKPWLEQHFGRPLPDRPRHTIRGDRR